MNENFENREQKKEWVSQPIDRKVEAIGYGMVRRICQREE